jgi:hypothetical protein
MANIGLRQMIILGVMTIVILYAAVDYLALDKKGPGADAGLSNAELNTFVSDLTASVGRAASQSYDALILNRAEREWAADPFLDRKAYRSWTEVKVKPTAKKAEVAPLPVTFVYSGYIAAGRQRMAIINGNEYREGDTLDIAGFVLKGVSPARVVIENRKTGTTLEVPLQE